LPSVISADLVDRFLIVLIILTTRLHVVEEAGLRFWRHIIRTEAEAKGAWGRPSAQELR
jgi:hypothetical protein